MTNPNPNPNPTPPPPPPPVSSPLPSKEQVGTEPDTAPEAAGADAEKVEEVTGEVDKSVVTGEQGDQQMEEAVGGGGGEDGSGHHSSPATVFRIRLKQPPSGLRHKMRVPELCRNFSAVAWCAKLNAIACASETCARIPSSNASPPFWIPIHILNPERPTECAVFNVRADSPRDFVQFIEWSPWSCPRALLVANFHGRITIWTQPSQGPVNLVRDASTWQCEYEWRQDLAVVTKWLSGMSPYRWLPSNSSNPPDPKTFETRFLQQHSQTTSVKWPNMLCICSVFSSGSVQLHWAQWPSQNGTPLRWFSTSKGLLGAGPSGIMAADAIITESGSLHVAGVPLVNPSTVVVWEVMAGAGNGFQTIPKVTVNGSVSPSLNPPSWTGFAPLAAYLFSLQEYLSAVSSDTIQGKKQGDDEEDESGSIHCSPVSNFSAYVSPEAAAQSDTTTTWGSGVTAIAFDPTRAGSVISVVIVEGQYMSPYDPDEGPSITGWRVQCWASSLKPVVLHPIFGNPSSSTFGGQIQTPMQTVWLMRVNKSIAPTDDLRNPQSYIPPTVSADQTNSSDCSVERATRLSFDPYDLPNDVRQLAQIVYSPHASEVAVAFLRGGVHMFSGPGFNQVDSYHVNVGTAIATPAFSSSGCCLASVWHDTVKDRTILKIIRVLPPAVSQEKVSSAMWERAIADRFWWSLLADVDWWDAVGCTQSAAEDGIVSLNSVIAVLDADFHALPTVQHRQHHSPNLDRIKCRLLEGTNAQDVRALVLDMQARLLLDMLGKGIEAAMVNPSNMLPEPWQATGEMLSGIESDKMIVEQALVPSIQAYVDAVLDLASHFITRLRRYASFCRTLASHAVGASSGPNSARSIVSSPPQSNNNINNNNNNNNNINNNTPAQPTTNQAQNGSATGPASGSASQMQEWVQGAIAKISNNNDSSSPATSANTVSGGTRSSSFMPISINTGTFPGTPAVRLIGDCHFLHRLCQLLLFCLIFRRRQAPRLLPGRGDKILDPGLQKGILGNAKVEMKIEEGTGPRGLLGPKPLEEGSKLTRLGSGNAGQGYTSDEVKVLFLILVDLCRRTNQLQHPLPASQVGTSNIIIRLHYIDGNYTVLPEVVEASLGPHMQNMPRPRGADAAGLLLRELELHPPAEEWHRRNMFGGPWSDPDDMGPLDNNNNLERLKVGGDSMEMDLNDYCSGVQALWPRKRRLSERDAAFGLRTSVGLGSYIGIMGSRRDVIMAVWKTGLDGVWYKCVRCLRQTCAFAQARGEGNATNEREAWFISRWIHGCPMCGGTWVKVV